MHLLEAYAIVSGAKIDKCFIEEEFIQLPDKKFITIHPYNPKGSGRQYKYWDLVIDTLYSNIKFDYDIIQIGGADDTKYKCNTNYLGKTSYNSLAYLMKHSQLHIGFDSFPAHLASYYDIRSIIIFAHYASNTQPYFSKPGNLICLEPDFKNLKKKPTFAQEDPLDLINTISPNTIIEHSKKFLKI